MHFFSFEWRQAQSDTAVGNFTLILFLLQHAVWAVVLIREAYCILYIQAKKNIYYARLRIGVNHHSHLGMR